MKKILFTLSLLFTGYVFGIEPTNEPRNSNITNITCTSARVQCQSGNGQFRIIVILDATNPITVPVDGQTYTPNSNFGSGSNLGNNNFVVGSGFWGFNNVTINNLPKGRKYYVVYYEANAWPTVDYLTSKKLLDSFTTYNLIFDLQITKTDSCQNTNNITFTNKSTFGLTTNYTIFYGDGNQTSNFTNSSHKYINSGNKVVFISASPSYGCPNTSPNYSVFIIPSPKAIITLLSPQTQCITNNLFKVDNTTTFDIVPSTSLSQTWYFTPVDSITTPKAENVYIKAGSYKILLRSYIYYNGILTGCWDTVSKYVYVKPIPKFSLGKDDTICDGTNRLISVPNLGNIIWDDNSTSLNRNITTGGTYWAEINNGYCSYRDSIWFSTMNSPVIPDLFDSLLCNGLTIKLGVPKGSYTLLWTTGEKTDTIKVTSTGSYTITAKNVCGSISKIANITFKNCKGELYIPSAFTPVNIDERNDKFNYYGSDIIIDRVIIFNRWGQEVFSTTTDERWDGTYMGKRCQEGYYSYIITYRHIIGTNIKRGVKKGLILLL